MRCSRQGCGVDFGIFNWKYLCGKCKKHYCSNHFDEGPGDFWQEAPGYCCKGAEGLCVDCTSEFNEVLDDAREIEVFPATYKGKKARIEKTGSHHISTGWYRNPSDVDTALSVIAAALGCNLVVEKTLQKGTGSETSDSGKGTHHYTTFSGTATAGLSLRKS